MSSEEKDDYQADIRFGEWLRSQRVKSGLTLEAAAQMAVLAPERLKGLEMGLSDRGITRHEAIRISTLYRVKLDELLVLASKS